MGLDDILGTVVKIGTLPMQIVASNVGTLAGAGSQAITQVGGAATGVVGGALGTAAGAVGLGNTPAPLQTTSKDDDNTLMYVGIGVGSIVFLGLAGMIIMKKGGNKRRGRN